MSVEENVQTLTAIAGEDLTAGLFKFGVYNSSGQIVVQTTAQGAVAGVIYMNAASGAAFTLATGGRVKVIAGAGITAGAKVATDGAGKVITWVDAAGNNCVGFAIDGASTSDVIAIQLGGAASDVGGGS